FACLSSRFPKGVALSPEDLLRVERAEECLRALGFRQYRARHHGDLCRIEIDPADFAKVLDGETRRAIIDALTRAGYRHATLDLAGYRTGSTAGR
ncbi:MAG TPA: TIGR00268 family protein, partial [Candidatus Hydrogenedentes bacterium]|nr:TIGR00268 family protein [Candidatus Hydrogenedentota bacterium]